MKDNKNKIRSPQVSPEARSLAVNDDNKPETLQKLSEIDPDLLTGKPAPSETTVTTSVKTDDNSGKHKPSAPEAEIELDRSDSDPVPDPLATKNAGILFVIAAAVIVAIVAGLSFIIDTGMDKSFISPLNIHGTDVPSNEFSFMYHYELLNEGVDLFASDTEKMLSSPYPDDDSFPTYRDYFRYITAQDLQKMNILYDDATSNGYSIEPPHYDRANAYINWLKTKASSLKVSLNTYIKGVYGSQVDEQCIINVLAKKYFTDDYAEDEKLTQLSASEEQAQEAYSQSKNIYDLVNYKILRLTYEQRNQAFIDTANLHANEIITNMAGDPSKFEECAAKFFSGVAQNALEQKDSTLVPDCRYEDFTHNDFRDWLFDSSRKSGDSTIIADEDGFPIILVFVSRDKMTKPLRDCYVITCGSGEGEGEGEQEASDISANQKLSQEIYDYIKDSDSCNEVENLYNDQVLSGSLSVIHDDSIYREKYKGEVGEWINSSDRKLGDKTLIEEEGKFYILYYISESPNPEWYDRVNSFLRMNNYQSFIDAKSKEYTWTFNEDGLKDIRDVP